jgi:hypothetical protein
MRCAAEANSFEISDVKMDATIEMDVTKIERGHAADGAWQKGPAIGDGSESGRKRPQLKSIRGSVMCRNSHTETETPGLHRRRWLGCLFD